MRIHCKTIQTGLTTLELLLSLTIVSSITAMTLEMAEQAEASIHEYQEQTDIRNTLKKLHIYGAKKEIQPINNQNEE